MASTTFKIFRYCFKIILWMMKVVSYKHKTGPSKSHELLIAGGHYCTLFCVCFLTTAPCFKKQSNNRECIKI